jgi:MFS family permease
VFLSVRLEWGFHEVGALLALWVIGYGAIQSAAPALIRRWTRGHAPEGRATFVLALLLAGTSVAMAVGIPASTSPTAMLVVGLGVFGAIFAVNSSVHSYLILAYSDGDKVAMNVGFYYMANAGGRLVGTLLSGALYQLAGIRGCLWGTAVFAAVTAGVSLLLPRTPTTLLTSDMVVDGGD